MQEITPPARIDGSPVKLSAAANWLVCEKICIPGNANLTLDLAVSKTTEPRNPELFARYRRLLPQSFPVGKNATSSWSRSGADFQLKIASQDLSNYRTVD